MCLGKVEKSIKYKKFSARLDNLLNTQKMWNFTSPFICVCKLSPKILRPANGPLKFKKKKIFASTAKFKMV